MNETWVATFYVAEDDLYSPKGPDALILRTFSQEEDLWQYLEDHLVWEVMDYLDADYAEIHHSVGNDFRRVYNQSWETLQYRIWAAYRDETFAKVFVTAVRVPCEVIKEA